MIEISPIWIGCEEREDRYGLPYAPWSLNSCLPADFVFFPQTSNLQNRFRCSGIKKDGKIEHIAQIIFPKGKGSIEVNVSLQFGGDGEVVGSVGASGKYEDDSGNYAELEVSSNSDGETDVTVSAGCEVEDDS